MVIFIETIIIVILVISFFFEAASLFQRHRLVLVTDFLFFKDAEVPFIFVFLDIVLLALLIIQHLLLFRTQRLTQQAWRQHLGLPTER